MATTKTNPEPKATKRPADYVKLADETELIRDGLRSRVEKVEGHIAEMLKDVPHGAAVMQSFSHLANWSAQLYEVQTRLDRYIVLRDRDGKGETPDNA